MKNLLKGLMAITVAMGITTSAHAGWVRIRPDLNRIDGIMVQANRSVVFVQSNGCTGASEIKNTITLLPTQQQYNQHLLLFHRASLEGLWMDVLVNCTDTSTGTVVLFVQH